MPVVTSQRGFGLILQLLTEIRQEALKYANIFMKSGNTAGTNGECQKCDYNERSALFRLTQTNEIDCSLHAIYEDKSGKRVQLSLYS